MHTEADTQAEIQSRHRQREICGWTDRHGQTRTEVRDRETWTDRDTRRDRQIETGKQRETH